MLIERCLAVVAGLFLATLTFWPYLPWPGAVAAHNDHAPRHGGQLAMLGEHHVEVRRAGGLVEVFVSDAWRRPLTARGGSITDDNGSASPLLWSSDRLVAADHTGANRLDVVVVIDDKTRLAISFDVS